MYTEEQIHISIDQHTAAQFPAMPIVFDNQDDTAASQGAVPWLKQKVVFKTANQIILGNTTPFRGTGAVVFIIYVRKGTGTSDRDKLHQRVIDSFRSQQIGGATFLNAQLLNRGESENWQLIGLQIPFFFNSL